MYTARTSRLFLLVVFAAGVFLAGPVGCQKKCQPPAAQRFRFLRETPWRLVETNNPSQAYRNLTRTTFQIWEFRVNFTGDVKKVENNDEFDTPILEFKWNVDTASRILRIRFSTVDTGEGEEGQSTSEVVGTTDYYYELSNELNLQEVRRGYTYRFVPFQGVVDPDNDCTF